MGGMTGTGPRVTPPTLVFRFQHIESDVLVLKVDRQATKPCTDDEV
jgi:hypothetical protein